MQVSGASFWCEFLVRVLVRLSWALQDKILLRNHREIRACVTCKCVLCCAAQGLQGGVGMKGEKGIPGFPGPRVSVYSVSVLPKCFS